VPLLALHSLWYAVNSSPRSIDADIHQRRLPWQSTLQVSLTLALANPVLWYLLDRSMPGLAFSSAVGVVGTAALLLVNPDFVPVPAIHQAVASEQIGVYTWLASILFCTSLCFGAIGRKLQL
jgi:Insulin-induced protein (INSIG)